MKIRDDSIVAVPSTSKSMEITASDGNLLHSYIALKTSQYWNHSFQVIFKNKLGLQMRLLYLVCLERRSELSDGLYSRHKTGAGIEAVLGLSQHSSRLSHHCIHHFYQQVS